MIVCNNSGPGREAVAEHALGFMLTLAKKISLADRMIRRGKVQDRAALRSSELLGKTLGIVGVGQIGGRLIELCAPFAMEVLAYDPYLSDEDAAARGVTKVDARRAPRLGPTSCTSTARSRPRPRASSGASSSRG